MNTILQSALIFIFISMLFSCACRTKTAELNFSGPPTMIFKLRNPENYQLVPVELSEDKNSILSYPAVSDIYKDGRFTYPSKLKMGYLLDNRGIGTHTALLKINYEEYAKLPSGFTADDLFPLILDTSPFVSLFNCGNRFRFKNEVEELNEMIMKKKLKECKCVVKNK